MKSYCRFNNGPAKGILLEPTRFPKFLRVVYNELEECWDCCDQIGDSPKRQEKPHAYILTSQGGVHVDGMRDGKRFGEWRMIYAYSLCAEQPLEETMRDNPRWQEWCREYAERIAPPAEAQAVLDPVVHPGQDAPEIRPADSAT